MNAFRIPAPAKLNFFLHVTGRRADGYHFIESLAGFTGLADMLEIMEAENISLSIDGPFSKALDKNNNLILRAAHALHPYTEKKRGAHISLTKNIPVGAGLGGGSSDAAAALRGLMEVWQLTVADETLHAIALSLGSDVPVCLRQKTSWIGGVGEQVHAVEMGVKAWVVLVNPGVPLLTADVYRTFSGNFSPASNRPLSIASLDALVEYVQPLHNALETPAIALQPVIGDILAALRETPCAVARMSGSGATCFALYDNQLQATEAAQHIAQTHPAWWVTATTLRGE